MPPTMVPRRRCPKRITRASVRVTTLTPIESSAGSRATAPPVLAPVPASDGPSRARCGVCVVRKMRRVAFLIAILALSALSFAIGTTVRRPRPAAPPPVVTARVPGIVLVCVDTLRADGVEADAVSEGLPSVRAFAQRATAFSDAIAPSAWTLPSVASLLTGLHLTTHGVLELSADARLAGAVPTLASQLERTGVRPRRAPVAGGSRRRTGSGPGSTASTWTSTARPPSQAIVRFARGTEPNRPFFLFLHTYGAHDPYGGTRPRCSPGRAPTPTPR